MAAGDYINFDLFYDDDYRDAMAPDGYYWSRGLSNRGYVQGCHSGYANDADPDPDDVYDDEHRTLDAVLVQDTDRAVQVLYAYDLYWLPKSRCVFEKTAGGRLQPVRILCDVPMWLCDNLGITQ